VQSTCQRHWRAGPAPRAPHCGHNHVSCTGVSLRHRLSVYHVSCTVSLRHRLSVSPTSTPHPPLISASLLGGWHLATCTVQHAELSLPTPLPPASARLRPPPPSPRPCRNKQTCRRRGAARRIPPAPPKPHPSTLSEPPSAAPSCAHDPLSARPGGGGWCLHRPAGGGRLRSRRGHRDLRPAKRGDDALPRKGEDALQTAREGGVTAGDARACACGA